MRTVNVARYEIAADPDALKTTLGSCVGVVFYSPTQKAGGMAHILLSEAPVGRIVHKGKYARPAIMALHHDLRREYGELPDLQARLYGGASMFNMDSKSFIHRIGEDNVRVAKDTLADLKIPLIHFDTGGTAGRSLTFYLDDGRILMRANGKEKFIYKI